MDTPDWARREARRTWDRTGKARKYVPRDRTTIGPSQLPTGTLGALSELLASTDLLAQGFEVFRALSPACSCDLIACRGGLTLRIEVRTGQCHKSRIHFARGPGDRCDHYCVVLHDGRLFYDPPLPGLGGSGRQAEASETG
jgi:hypothetical protein